MSTVPDRFRHARRGLLVALLVSLLLRPAVAHASGPSAEQEVVPYRYAKAASTYQVYDAPGGRLLETRQGEGIWLAVYEEREGWYRVGPGQWVPSTQLYLTQPSQLRGVDFRATALPASVGWVTSEALNVRRGPGIQYRVLRQLERYALVHILEEARASDGALWYRVDEGAWVHSGLIGRVKSAGRPQGVGADERWIEVDLSQQVLMAHQGDEMVYATLVATGLPRWRTVEGLFRIWVKAQSAKMSGGSREEGDYYWLGEVPWIMYFHQGYGLHGAYWHDAFGAPRSHGCVNLSPYDAWWLFRFASPPAAGGNWTLSTEASPGTWVYVH